MKGYRKSHGDGSLFCYIRCTFEQLVQILGKPHFRKYLGSHVSWMFEHKTTHQNFMVYDYQQHDVDSEKDVMLWHFGFTDHCHDDALRTAQEIFPNFEICDTNLKVLQPKKYIVRVALGEEMSRKAEEKTGWFDKASTDKGEVLEEVFNTLGEAEAFVRGLELMNGNEGFFAKIK